MFGLSSQESLGLQCEELGHGGGHRTAPQGEKSMNGAPPEELVGMEGWRPGPGWPDTQQARVEDTLGEAGDGQQLIPRAPGCVEDLGFRSQHYPHEGLVWCLGSSGVFSPRHRRERLATALVFPGTAFSTGLLNPHMWCLPIL